MENILDGKRILIVDDEPDILETLVEILDTCLVDSAPNFETAQKFLNKNRYDLAILDIMGVRGYELLELANERNIPALMLTAHAVSHENLVKSIKGGADSYLPKEEMGNIKTFLIDILKSQEKGESTWEPWDRRLSSSYFERKWGGDWKDQDREFWKKYKAGKKDNKP